jgi:hypothetical protein
MRELQALLLFNECSPHKNNITYCQLAFAMMVTLKGPVTYFVIRSCGCHNRVAVLLFQVTRLLALIK